MSEFPNDYNRSWTEPPRRIWKDPLRNWTEAPRSWRDTAKGWADTTADTARSAADRARTYAPKTYDGSVQAANYVSGSIREHPLSASAVLPLLGYVLGFLLHHQSSDAGAVRYNGGNVTEAAADAAQAVADRARSAAPATYDRAAQTETAGGGSIGLFGLLAAIGLGYALGLVHKSDQEQRSRVEWRRVD